MWFEADPVFPFFPTNELSLRETGFEPVPLSPDDRPAFADRVSILNEISSGDLHFASDWSYFDGLFLPLPTIADEWSEGGTKDGDRVSNEGIITVTGTRIFRLDLVNWWDTGPGADLFWTVHLDGGGGAFDFPPPDAEVIDVVLNFDRPLTDSETAAFEQFKAAIEALTTAINALPDSAEVRLPNGAYVTGAALKALWANTDFIITDNQTYQDGAGFLGEAAMIGNQPTISLNIQALNQFNDFTGGLNWLIAHELGHLTQWGTPLVYDQRTANDIARALLSGAGLPYFATPGFGYSPDAPTGFTGPTATGGDGSGPGGGGGGGGGGDFIP